MHAAIKRHIPSSTDDIRSAIRGLVSFWQAQAARLLAEDTFESGQSSTDTLNHTFSEIRGKYQKRGVTIPLEAVDRFWWLNRKLLVAGDNLPLDHTIPSSLRLRVDQKVALA
ncbi:hypothetical protein E4U19_005916 [Claviceps sp. Clav32 group G5]|nr:hypothetical protein E4U19_005916 [Claviceps sp. Clav32 group G5]KAG6042311.1 hypothetical protein E4U39_006134 [Claviceps sp. Clav50 group G5]